MNFNKSADFKTVYANWVQTGFGPFDISLLFGDAVPSDLAVFEVEHKVRVQLNPAEAKILVAMLAECVNNYEKVFGKIHIPVQLAQSGVTGNEEENSKESPNTEGV